MKAYEICITRILLRVRLLEESNSGGFSRPEVPRPVSPPVIPHRGTFIEVMV